MEPQRIPAGLKVTEDGQDLPAESQDFQPVLGGRYQALNRSSDR